MFIDVYKLHIFNYSNLYTYLSEYGSGIGSIFFFMVIVELYKKHIQNTSLVNRTLYVWENCLIHVLWYIIDIRYTKCRIETLNIHQSSISNFVPTVSFRKRSLEFW